MSKKDAYSQAGRTAVLQNIQGTLQFLQRFPPFNQMEHGHLAYLVEQCQLRFYASGESIVKPADGPVEHFYIVKQGRVVGERQHLVKPGVETTFEITSGECFPLAALLGERATRTEHLAGEDTFCLQLNKAAFIRVFSLSEAFRDFALRGVSSLLHSTAQVERCVIEGQLGVMQPLVERLRDNGITVTERAGSGVIQVGDATLALSDGRLATQRAREEGLRNLVLVDLALDYSKATRIAISWSADTTHDARDQAVGLLTRAGLKVTAVADLPGLVVLRTVAMLANEAADAVLQGVGSAADIDLAMRAGVNYPCGPLAWASRIGISQTLRVLDNLQRSYGESRYRPSLLLRRCEAQGVNLHD
jgi:hypothetical protein